MLCNKSLRTWWLKITNTILVGQEGRTAKPDASAPGSLMVTARPSAGTVDSSEDSSGAGATSKLTCMVVGGFSLSSALGQELSFSLAVSQGHPGSLLHGSPQNAACFLHQNRLARQYGRMSKTKARVSLESDLINDILSLLLLRRESLGPLHSGGGHHQGQGFQEARITRDELRCRPPQSCLTQRLIRKA